MLDHIAISSKNVIKNVLLILWVLCDIVVHHYVSPDFQAHRCIIVFRFILLLLLEHLCLILRGIMSETKAISSVVVKYEIFRGETPRDTSHIIIIHIKDLKVLFKLFHILFCLSSNLNSIDAHLQLLYFLLVS